MQVIAVESTTLATIAYDDAQRLLQLQFRSGAVYQYFGVPAAVHQALLRADAKGRHFNQAIRGWFPYRLVPNSQMLDEEVRAEWRR
jgi:KTSC domain